MSWERNRSVSAKEATGDILIFIIILFLISFFAPGIFFISILSIIVGRLEAHLFIGFALIFDIFLFIIMRFFKDTFYQTLKSYTFIALASFGLFIALLVISEGDLPIK